MVGCSQHQIQKEVGWGRSRGRVSKADFKVGLEVALWDSGTEKMVPSKAFCHRPSLGMQGPITTPRRVGVDPLSPG